MNKSILLGVKLLIIAIIYSCNNANESYSSSLTQNNLVESIQSSDSIKKYPDISKEHLLGKFDPAKDSLFVEIPQKYCLIRKEYIHKDVLNPYIQMYEDAAKDGVKLGIVSATRNFDIQKWLWNQRYYKSSDPKTVVKSVLSYLAMPGTSRHHWGTDIDMMSTKLNYFETAEGKKAYQWLVDNASKYGFYQVYTKNRNIGYNEEKWHWTYLPISKEFQKQFREKIIYDDITGFNGSEIASQLNVIDEYVFGIDSFLLKE